jgi:hypothetical protein
VGEGLGIGARSSIDNCKLHHTPSESIATLKTRYTRTHRYCDVPYVSLSSAFFTDYLLLSGLTEAFLKFFIEKKGNGIDLTVAFHLL